VALAGCTFDESSLRGRGNLDGSVNDGALAFDSASQVDSNTSDLPRSQLDGAVGGSAMNAGGAAGMNIGGNTGGSGGLGLGGSAGGQIVAVPNLVVGGGFESGTPDDLGNASGLTMDNPHSGKWAYRLAGSEAWSLQVHADPVRGWDPGRTTYQFSWWARMEGGDGTCGVVTFPGVPSPGPPVVFDIRPASGWTYGAFTFKLPAAFRESVIVLNFVQWGYPGCSYRDPKTTITVLDDIELIALD